MNINTYNLSYLCNPPWAEFEAIELKLASYAD